MLSGISYCKIQFKTLLSRAHSAQYSVMDLGILNQSLQSLMLSSACSNIKLLLYKNINYYYIMIKDLIKKNEKHLFVFIIFFPLALGFYKLLTGKKKLLPHLTNPISLINLFIIFSLILISKYFTDNKKLKKATKAAAISTVIALFAYHDLVFTTFYFVWMLTYFYSTEIGE